MGPVCKATEGFPKEVTFENKQREYILKERAEWKKKTGERGRNTAELFLEVLTNSKKANVTWAHIERIISVKVW